MPLVKCSECGKEISDKAESCPNCGNPIKPVLIERTGKSWKAARLISWIFFLIGFFTFVSQFQQGGWDNPMAGFGFSLAFLSFIGIIIAKFGAWWNHK
jgi:predicted RNA-binding Zn-ribbon protein involved in translation (DUF1610 family)